MALPDTCLTAEQSCYSIANMEHRKRVTPDILIETVGDYYRSVGTINGFVHVPSSKPTSWEDRIDDFLFGSGPDAWYRARFSDEETGITSTIWEWRNGACFADYRDSITIKQNGTLVYTANVHRDDAYDQIDIRFRNETKWFDAVRGLTQRYCRIG